MAVGGGSVKDFKKPEALITVDLFLKDGKLYLPYQGDAENIALETMDDNRKIYFDPIPLTDKLYLKHDRESNYGWEILAREDD